MELTPAAERAIEIVQEIEALQNELIQLTTPQTEEPRQKRKYTRRKPVEEEVADDEDEEETDEEQEETEDEDATPRPFECCDSRGGTHKKGCVNNKNDYTPKVLHPCCGSKGPRHKNDCPEKETSTEASDETDSAEDNQEIDLRCGDCEKQFVGVYLDAVCPDCESNTIYKMPN